MNKKYLASWLLVTGTLVAGLLVYPALPAMVASHWGLAGQVNGYMSKGWAVAFLPLLTAVLVLFLWALPKFDPLGKNIRQFRRHYDNFILSLVAFLTYVQFLLLVWNLGFRFDLIRWLIPALALFIYELGIVLPTARPNWFFGIRTPWTLSNGRVWYHTHERSGKLFRWAAILALGGWLWPFLAVYFLLVPILGASLYLIIFSYLDWRNETN